MEQTKKHTFGSKWYESRRETLKRLGIEAETRPEVYAKWRGWLKDQRKTKKHGEIADKCGLTTGLINIDSSKMGLTALRRSLILPKTSLQFDDDPFKLASMQFSYENGVVRHKGAWSHFSVSKIGTVVKDGDNVICKSRTLTYKQLVWLLHNKEMPDRSLRVINNELPVTFENLEQVAVNPDDEAARASVKETVNVLGRDRVLDVDSSRSFQPKTKANEYRMAKICASCKHYLSRCLEADMKLRCIISSKERAKLMRKTHEIC